MTLSYYIQSNNMVNVANGPVMFKRNAMQYILIRVVTHTDMLFGEVKK